MTPVKMMIMFSIALTLFLAILPHLLWLLGWCIGKFFHHSLPYAPFGWTTIGIVVACWLLLAYGFFVGRWQVQTSRITYTNPEIPNSFDGTRLVHISDFHLGTFDDNPQQLQKFVDSINAQHPDIICFTGDLVTMGLQEAEPYVSTLRQLRATHGIYSVLGNHDFLIYSRDFANEEARNQAVKDLARFERETLGWHLLRNDNHAIVNETGDTLTIIGVDNTNCANQGFQTINRGDLPKAMAGAGGFCVLLSHDPSHWTAEVLPRTNIPLTLSGHTHAAQVKLFGWTPAKLSFKETDGRYDHGSQTLYINIGLGCTAPFRIGANPEVTVIKLQSTTPTSK